MDCAETISILSIRAADVPTWPSNSIEPLPALSSRPLPVPADVSAELKVSVPSPPAPVTSMALMRWPTITGPSAWTLPPLLVRSPFRVMVPLTPGSNAIASLPDVLAMLALIAIELSA